MRRLVPIFLLLLAGPVTSQVYADDAASTVKRAAAADSKYTYFASGETRFRYRDKIITCGIRLHHKKPDRFRLEYLTPPLKGVIVGRNEERSWRYDPKLNKLTVTQQAACVTGGERCDLLLGNFRAESAGNARIAGRPARAVVLKSAKGEVRKKLWVDDYTGVVLRSEDYDTRGHLQASTEYKSIKFVDDLPRSLFATPQEKCVVEERTHREFSSLAEISKAVGFQVSVPGYIPRGFKLDGYRAYDCSCEHGRQAAYIRYTNGLSSISVFQMKDCCKAGKVDPCTIMDCGRGNLTSLRAGGKSIVVIGDVSKEEVRKIAQSIR